MAKKLKLQTKVIAVIIPFLLVGGILAFVFAPIPLPDFIDYATFETDEWALRFPAPLALTGAESYIIQCDLRNKITIKDQFGTTKLTIDKSAPFSPAIELSFIIPVSGNPQFGSAVIQTFLSCDNSPLASDGFRAFLHDGSITTKVQATDVNRSFKDISQRIKPISSVTDMNNRQNFELNTLTITENQLQNSIGDATSYPSTVRALVTGDLQFRQCLSSNPVCSTAEANNNWIHTVSTGDAFTAFGLLVEGAVFSPLTRTQELVITESGLETNNRLNIKDDNRVNYQIRITDYDIREGSPQTKIWTPQNTVFQSRNEGIITSTDPSNSRIFIRTSSVTLPTTNLGLWCFELQATEGERQASRKCVTTYLADTPIVEEMPTGTDTTGANINSGEVRLRYEVTTTSGTKQNDILATGGTPVSFSPLGLLAVGSPAVFLDIFLQPQIFFDEGVIKDLNIVSGSADIVYTGQIKLPDSTVTIGSLQLKPNSADFTKNQASIILPSTKITASELELLMKEQGGIPTASTPLTLEFLVSGDFQLRDVGTNAIHQGTFTDQKFSWNLDYVPPKDTGGDECASSSPPASCDQPETCAGIIVASTCVLDNLTTCFDANGNEVQCTDLTNEDNVNGELPTVIEGTVCFDSSGVNEVDCDTGAECDPNTDPDRCGGGAFIGEEEEIIDNSNAGTGGECSPPLTQAECAEALKEQQEQFMLPTLTIGENFTQIAIVVGAGISLLIVVAIVIRFVKNR